MARTLVIGDIHGCWDELRDLFGAVALTDDDVVVSVGDLVDRGPDPRAVVDWFRRRPGAVVVCGNHERKHVRATQSHSQDITRLQLGEGYLDDVAWMATLPYRWERDDVIVVHAAVIPDAPLAELPDDVACGSTAGEEKLRERLGGRWWHESYDGDRPVVFGHHVVDRPLVREGKVYGIDTGACHGGALTGLLLPSFELVSVPSRADHWRATRRTWNVPVLRQRPWGSMTFEQLEKKATDLQRSSDPDAVAYLDEVRGWAAAVRGGLPALAAAVDAAVAALVAQHGPEGFGAAAAAHPAASTLLRRRAGRLSTEHLGCAGPDQVLALARALGVPLGAPPRP